MLLVSAVFMAGAALAVLPPSRAIGADVVVQAKSVLDLLASRSPGERTQGVLTKTKAARVAGANAGKGPRQRLLGRTMPPGEKAASAGLPNNDLTDLFASSGPLILEPGPGAMPLAGDDDVFAPVRLPFAGGFLPIGGGLTGISPGTGSPSTGSPDTGGTPGSGGNPDISPPVTPTPQPPVTAVPEPGTWAFMILGMGLCGLMMRRRKHVRVTFSGILCGSTAL